MSVSYAQIVNLNVKQHNMDYAYYDFPPERDQELNVYQQGNDEAYEDFSLGFGRGPGMLRMLWFIRAFILAKKYECV